MILKNKKALIFSSLLTLLPIPVGLALWDRFPAVFAGGMPFNVFYLPLTLLAVQWLCIGLTTLDEGNKKRNRKPLSMIVWISPFLSCLVSGMMYALFLGFEFSPVSWTVGSMGLLFAVIGNYMPKTRMNATLGIKIRWTYSSEENWNATHRFAGKLWVIGGLSLILCALLPEKYAFAALFGILAMMIGLPCWYSCRFYRKELAQGKAVKAEYGPMNRKILKFSAVFLGLLLIFVAVLMFTGDLQYQFSQDSFAIEASFYGDMTVDYGDISAIEYRNGNVPGFRVGGFGSFRLLMGLFKNDEFGIHTRYTYYAPEACVVLTLDEQILVLSGKDAAETKVLYDMLLDKIS